MNPTTVINITEITPQDSIQLQRITEIATSLLKSNHYQWIQTPTIDDLSALSPGFGPHLNASVVRCLGAHSNDLILRPDNTTPIARIIAGAPPKDPVRLFYNAPKFQKDPQSHGILETLEFGFELIGDPSAEADAEILILVSTLLKKLGFKNHIIDVGHSDTAKSVSPDQLQALLRNDFVQFGHLPERISMTSTSKIRHATTLQNALKGAKEASHIYFNTGLVKQLDYYTGIVFEVYIPECGYPIASGGRYDSLLKSYGKDLPAVGAALNINNILSVLGHKK
jgi:ATP phosphoribosyltransferase regulatory subunit